VFAGTKYAVVSSSEYLHKIPLKRLNFHSLCPSRKL